MTKSTKLNPDIHFRLLNIIEENPHITQRELAKKLNVSLGGINYCLKALIDIGHIKADNFHKSPKKLNYLYLLTPKGVSQKTSLTSDFLKRKMAEYRDLKNEIDLITSKLKR